MRIHRAYVRLCTVALSCPLFPTTAIHLRLTDFVRRDAGSGRGNFETESGGIKQGPVAGPPDGHPVDIGNQFCRSASHQEHLARCGQHRRTEVQVHRLIFPGVNIGVIQRTVVIKPSLRPLATFFQRQNICINFGQRVVLLTKPLQHQFAALGLQQLGQCLRILAFGDAEQRIAKLLQKGNLSAGVLQHDRETVKRHDRDRER
nr:hypothetical protein Dp_00001 [Serratia proteamaculans]